MQDIPRHNAISYSSLSLNIYLNMEEMGAALEDTVMLTYQKKLTIILEKLNSCGGTLPCSGRKNPQAMKTQYTLQIKRFIKYNYIS